jgi:hypothetical protein
MRRRSLLAAGLCAFPALLATGATTPDDVEAVTDKDAPGPSWDAKPYAEVQALDKVNARRALLVVKAGDTATFGSLSIQVQSCVVRPPNQAKDAAAFLVIHDSHEGEPGFAGWMFASAPSVSMLEHPIYDVRVTGCRS